ncbi:MAG: UDP-N-acetylglucosamine 2-epimerase (hydrolyzing) [Leptospiraceae bacterium]|nr:UDP-N-acetylglucosamine 2-epimerase (hydrolyzing) [Leptospiraceae bacterium]
MSSNRKIALLTVGRSDLGLYETIINLIENDPELDLQLLVTGSHFDSRFGNSVEEIEKKGINYTKGLEMLLSSDSPQALGKSMGLGVISISQAFAEKKPDILLVLGDRVEMICGPLAAINFNIPICHIHGGAVTEGAVDDMIRHAITKMSHLHFVSSEVYKNRVIQMGEESWRVFNYGAPGLDRIDKKKLLNKDEISGKLNIDLNNPTILVTFHPVTLELKDKEIQIENLLSALDKFTYQKIITYPNNDVGNEYIIQKINEYKSKYPEKVVLLKNAGNLMYLSLLNNVTMMVGNSSSGIVEAASFGLPVINIGTRQKGKVEPPNVITTTYEIDSIVEAMKIAYENSISQKFKNLINPYGDGKASERIVNKLKTIQINNELIRKKFIDIN